MDFVWKLYRNTLCCRPTWNGRASRCCHIESSFTAPPPCPFKCVFRPHRHLRPPIRWVVSHGNPEKMFPSNVLISLEAEKNPLSLIENPHKSSPILGIFFMTIKSRTFFVLCSNFYKKILSITRQRKDTTAVAQLTLVMTKRWKQLRNLSDYAKIMKIIRLHIICPRFWSISVCRKGFKGSVVFNQESSENSTFLF